MPLCWQRWSIIQSCESIFVFANRKLWALLVVVVSWNWKFFLSFLAGVRFCVFHWSTCSACTSTQHIINLNQVVVSIHKCDLLYITRCSQLCCTCVHQRIRIIDWRKKIREKKSRDSSSHQLIQFTEWKHTVSLKLNFLEKCSQLSAHNLHSSQISFRSKMSGLTMRRSNKFKCIANDRISFRSRQLTSEFI